MTWWRVNISGLDHRALVTVTIELSDDYRLHEEINGRWMIEYYKENWWIKFALILSLPEYTTCHNQLNTY